MIFADDISISLCVSLSAKVYLHVSPLFQINESLEGYKPNKLRSRGHRWWTRQPYRIKEEYYYRNLCQKFCSALLLSSSRSSHNYIIFTHQKAHLNLLNLFRSRLVPSSYKRINKGANPKVPKNFSFPSRQSKLQERTVTSLLAKPKQTKSSQFIFQHNNHVFLLPFWFLNRFKLNLTTINNMFILAIFFPCNYN